MIIYYNPHQAAFMHLFMCYAFFFWNFICYSVSSPYIQILYSVFIQHIAHLFTLTLHEFHNFVKSTIMAIYIGLNTLKGKILIVVCKLLMVDILHIDIWFHDCRYLEMLWRGGNCTEVANIFCRVLKYYIIDFYMPIIFGFLTEWLLVLWRLWCFKIALLCKF